EPFSIGSLLVSPARLELSSEAKTSRVELQVMTLVQILSERPNEVWTRSDLIDRIWGDADIGDESLTRVIYVLRKVLREDHGVNDLIKTIPKKGYQLQAPDVSAAGGHVSQKSDTPENSIAVLPFKNLSGDETQSYFADATTEELINALARIPGLKVIGRTSSLAFRDSSKDAGHIAAELNVRYILEGSARRDGGLIRITTQLIDAANGYQVWSQAYEESGNDLLLIQEKISQSIINDLASQLQVVTTEPLTLARSRSTKAYELFLQGRELTQRLNGQTTLLTAISLFEEAVALDPEFTEALGWLASVSAVVTEFAHTPDWQRHVQRARSAAEQCLVLDSSCSAAWFALGAINSRELRLADSLSCYLKASELDPHDPGSAFGVAIVYAAIGHHSKALDIAQQWVERDPLRAIWHGSLGGMHLMNDDRLAATASFQKCLDLGFGPAAFLLAQLVEERDGSRAAVQFMQDSYALLGPNEAGQLKSPLARWLVFNAFFGGQPIARWLVSSQLKRRVKNAKIQPTLAETLGFFFMDSPQDFMQAILTKPPAYVVFPLAMCFERSFRSKRIRSHPDFPDFAEQSGLAQAWQKFGLPDCLQPSHGTDGSKLKFEVLE
ncbi:MAG: winged helix-turn-helix domain-containing protein, partial [Pseudomonadota bacterium]